MAIQNGEGKTYRHHCGLCKKAPTQRCFDKMHVARCEVCQNVFTIKSSKSGGGCLSHSYSMGYNLTAKRLGQGRDGAERTPWELRVEQENAARREREERERAEAEQRKKAKGKKRH